MITQCVKAIEEETN
jgi:uncharacterized protein YueI